MRGKFKFVVVGEDDSHENIWEKTAEAAGKVYSAKTSKTVKEIVSMKEWLLRNKVSKRVKKVKEPVVENTDPINVTDSL